MCFLLKIIWFFWSLPVLLQCWFSTCLVLVHTLTPRKTEKGQSPEYFKIFGKNTILNEHPVYKHTRFPKIINLFLNRKFISHLSLSSRKIIIGAKQLVLYIFRVTMYADLIALVWHFHWQDNDFFFVLLYFIKWLLYIIWMFYAGVV